ncbi:hypothetical protein GYMLUDRAFT_253008 [Collybiopsis luxurians FD-317 M1]|uniref:DUF4100 domain-containing protein n=1 Tax=Collybiopsis luxurians FD-317 M1 TaxID=944289 RepID=A0A0D0B8D7_9AGAR|nr:hypothetical protein GYMLUDRAFT_253008 [Collybiopsis luxurians FD-317 M1]
MQDAGKRNNAPQYHFTSKVQEFANPELMILKIGDMRIEVPLFQLLGLSPQLSKMMLENTCTKREFIGRENQAKPAEYSLYDSSDGDTSQEALVSIGATMGPVSEERHVYVEQGNADINNFVFRCSSAAAQIPTNRFFAMTVGDVRLTINGTELLAMIDTGSELNVTGHHVPETAQLPMDFDGMRWSLKGINGDFEQLQGCAIDAPMRIGGHDFSHHIFISRQSIGRHNIILGQPFLQEFLACIDYERGAHCKLYLWEAGDCRNRPTLMISITDPSDPRNATAIRLGKDAKTSNAFIEEVLDEDFQY